MDWLLVGLLIFVLLNGVDMILTNAVIKSGGREFNPIVKWVYSKGGLYGMAILKGIILSLFAIQYVTKSLDMWTIWYFDFSYFVILTMMFFDLRKTGVTILRVSDSNEPNRIHAKE
jgi:hypothetical protein